VEGWEGLGRDDGAPRALIYTGNPLPWINVPTFVSLAMGQSASATLVESLAATYTRNVLTFVNTTAIAYRQNSAFLP